MKLVFVMLVALGLLFAGLLGHVRTVRAASAKKVVPVASLPSALERASKALQWLNSGTGAP